MTGGTPILSLTTCHPSPARQEACQTCTPGSGPLDMSWDVRFPLHRFKWVKFNDTSLRSVRYFPTFLVFVTAKKQSYHFQTVVFILPGQLAKGYGNYGNAKWVGLKYWTWGPTQPTPKCNGLCLSSLFPGDKTVQNPSDSNSASPTTFLSFFAATLNEVEHLETQL